MPSAFVYQPGDIPYDQYAEVFSLPVDSGIAISKGQILSISGSGNNAGHLVLPPTASGVPDLRAGLFQALESLPSQSSRGRTIQVMANGSRIVMRASAVLQWGQRVGLNGTGTTPSAYDTTGGTPLAESSNAYMGRVVEIVSLTSAREPKYQTAQNDFLIVQTGVL